MEEIYNYLNSFTAWEYIPESSLQKIKYEKLLLYSQISQKKSHYKLEEIAKYFDGIILVSNDVDCDFSLITHEKLLVKIKTQNEEDNKKTLLEIASYFSPQWICFMSSNEIFDPRYSGFKSIIDLDEKTSISFQYVVTKDDITYFLPLDSNCGIYQSPRMYNMSKCSFSEIINPKSRINKEAYPSNILFKRIINEKDFNDYGINLITNFFKINEIYFVAGQFKNVSNIEDSSLHKLIKNKLNVISEYLLERRKIQGNISLYSGDSGIALFLALYYRHTKNEKLFEKLNEYIDVLTNECDTSKFIYSSFCSGIAGYGWLINYLQKKKLIEVEEDYFEELDKILFEHLKSYCLKKEFDQMHQAISIGRYFLCRGKQKEVKLLLDALNASKESVDKEIKWPSYNYSNGNLKYDFGLAHGMSGYLYFLAQCYKRNYEKILCGKLINGILSFYDHNVQDFSVSNSFYPPHVPVNGYSPSHNNYKNRLAWCYGDAGVLYSLYLVAICTNNRKLEKEIISKFVIVSTRRDMMDTGVQDASFCHGASCLAHIFNRLYHYTQNIIFRETSLYWLKVALILGANMTSETGYFFNIANKQWEMNDSLLEGVSGVGLAFLSSLDFVDIDWDECMMLS